MVNGRCKVDGGWMAPCAMGAFKKRFRGLFVRQCATGGRWGNGRVFSVLRFAVTHFICMSKKNCFFAADFNNF